jgi:hypothetical protein
VDGQGFFRPVDIFLSADASDSDGYVSRVEFFADALKLGEVTTPPYSLIWSNPPLGTFHLTAIASDNWTGSNSSAVVTITVSNSPPSVALAEPADGSTFFEGTNVTFTALASDVDGFVTQVEFFEGTNSLGVLTNSPYTLVWSNVALGTYSLTAQATDNDGATTTSPAITISVVRLPLPVFSLISPELLGDNFIFSFPAASNWTYRVESSESLNPADWRPLTNFPGVGAIITITDAVNEATQRFYRVSAE